MTKGALKSGSSSWAQGGIAAVLSGTDSVQFHVDDTFVAGVGLCNLAATRFVVEQAPQAIVWLRELGVPFSLEYGELHRTVRPFRRRLFETVRRNPNITLFENHTLVDLITGRKLGVAYPACLGLYALDSTKDEVVTLQAPRTILVTGCAGKVYLYTSNLDSATGDGMAATWRAGYRVSDMEFMQFHPTCVYHADAKSFLISEAVRGEGGLLRLPDGMRFMPHVALLV